ncbi:MAG: alanine racemase [Thermoanaerobaculales bacterium]|nr:alanine racemase [Thermoanaerobaculales bacterium]
MTKDILLSQWMEVRSSALRSNLALFRSIIGDSTQLAAVVKANAYGHGLAAVVPVAAPHVDWFAVHTASEARAIRDLGFGHRILVMGYVSAADTYLLDADTHIFVSNSEVARNLGELKRNSGVSVPVHVKVDTGTNRQGINPDELLGLCGEVVDQGLDVVGLATHFANIEDTLEHEFARSQMERFRECIVRVRENGINPPWIHAACSAAALLFREADFTLVRVGISMYGHWPSRETQLSWRMGHPKGSLQLEPMLSWKTVVGQIQKLEAGETVGYGRTWTALRETRLAVLPVGYSDGYPRALGGRGRVLVHGRPAPVVGRVCMNISLVDVTDVPEVEVGDEVILLGRDGELEISAEELAGLAGTINYEFLSRLPPHVIRKVV